MITLRKYVELEDKSEIDFLIKYSGLFNMPVDTIGIGDLTERTFGEVKDLQYEIDKGLSFYEALKWFEKFNPEILKTIRIDKACQAFRFLIQEVSRINDIEKDLLSSPAKAEYVEAGIEDLNQLGIYLQLRQIATTFHMTVDEVKAMPYNDAFLELVTQKRISDFESRLQENRMRRQK